MLKKKRGKEGNAAKYTTRNQALVRLQLKLADFRRLCILKGIHPREPKKKTKGAHKTYYHVKDINFLAHEPLLELQRELRAQRKKIRKAKGRLETEKVERLERSLPRVSLDHLVKERYPSFIDALRDLDDALTMLHLFATLPADATFRIPAKRVNNARRLSLEWQAYVTRTHALRKVFISVKGIYYQAEVVGQQVTWLVPHQLMQVMPTDVDFRVMLTFLEFYETLMGFVNFKLYHELRLAYPPKLDPRLEKAAADLYAVMRKLAEAAAAAKLRRERKAIKAAAAASAVLLGAPADAAGAVEGSAGYTAEEGGEEEKAEGGEADEAAAEAAEKPPVDPEKEATEKLPVLRKQATASRMASLQSRLAAMEAVARAQGGEGRDEKDEEEVEGAGRKGRGEAEEEEGDEDDEETRVCRRLFRGLVFFLGREVPREPLLFVIRAFGGKASWEGEGAPAPETDESITHQVVDRPQQKHRILSREYVQPQWIFDCANARILLPSAPYAPGLVPPPHLSPFVNHEEEGYLPDYAAAIQRLKEAAAARDAATHKGTMGGMLGGGGAPLLELEGAHEVRMSGEGSVAVGGGEDEVKAEEAAMAAKIAEVAAEEKAYAADLAKELSGVPFSASLVQDKGGKEGEEGGEEEEDEKEEAGEEGEGGESEEEEAEDEEGAEGEEEKQGAVQAAAGADGEDGGKAMARMLMSRKRRGLYDAMQMGRAKKAAGVALLHERRLKAAAAAGGAKGDAAGGGAAGSGAGKKGGQQAKKGKQEKKSWR
ncbi:hypothetical protein CLOP_g16367 [Closterium sp. NIES-67]|nr:hypothetical protein CLOP_g16367 [Closterium sp. NIES-67]